MVRAPLLGRAAERSRLEDALDTAATGQGGLLAILGPAGIGTTRLLQAAAAAARVRQMAVRTATGAELERGFPLAVVRQLLEPALLRVTGAAGLLPALEAGGAARESPDEPVLRALHGSLARLAAQRSLLLVVDDVHWADSASVRALHYLARRLDGLPVLLLLGGREDEAEASPALRAVLVDPRAVVVRPSPLSPAAVGDLVRRHLGQAADPGVRAACHTATGGNPFLLTQLLDALVRRAASGAALDAAAVAGTGPPAVATAVAGRLARLPAAAEVACAVAVLGPDAEFRHVVRLAGLDPGAAAEAVALLARAEVLEDVRPLRFVHPVVRTALYEQLGPAQRAHQHRRAADLLLGEGTGPERVAPHLQLAEECADPVVVAVLRSAAEQALARSAPHAAVRLLERALREPPSPPARAAVLTELALAEALVRRTRTAAHLSEALSLTARGPRRVRLATLLAGVLAAGGEVPAAVRLLEDELRDAGPGEDGLALEDRLVQVARLDPSTSARAARRTARLRERAVVPGHGSLTPAQRLALVNTAVEMVRACHSADDAAAVAVRALDEGRLLADAPAEELAFGSAVMVLVHADRYDAAAHELRLAMAQARHRGSAVAVAVVSLLSALLAHRRGAVGEAQAHLAEAGATGALPLFFQPLLVKADVDVRLERDDVRGAGQLLTERDAVGDLPATCSWTCLLEARGRLRLAQGDPRAAAADLDLVGRRQSDLEELNPASLAWRSSAALAHAALDERDVAAALVADALERTRRFGAPRALGIALRSAGLVVGGREGTALLAEAVAVLEPSGADLELARALTDLGAALRRGHRSAEAREPLRRGLDLAVRCGSDALLARARTELAASGGRPRRLVLSGADALTPSQRRAAGMAARGLSNPQIAQALFVSSRTVEMHLTAAYRKLGIAGREELAAALGAPVTSDPGGG